jgi:hypothetical protein
MVESVDEGQLRKRSGRIEQCDGHTGEAIVVQLRRLLTKQYRHRVELCHQGFLQVRTLLVADLGPGPSIPEESHAVLCQSLKPCHQSATGRTELISAVREALDAYR